MNRIPNAALSIFAACCALSLGGCADPKAANQENFETAMRSYLAAHDQRQCTQNSVTFPAKFPDRTAYGSINSDTSQYDALVAAGLAQKSTHSTFHEAENWTPAWTEKMTTYSVSRDGERFVSESQGYDGASNVRFCYATKSLDRVTNFTIPGDMGGMTVSEVRYTYTLADVAPWANDEALQNMFADIHQTVAGARTTEETATLTLTNNGWEVAH